MKFSKAVEGYELAYHQGTDYSVVNVHLIFTIEIYICKSIARFWWAGKFLKGEFLQDGQRVLPQ
jgi:hypothetical protein